MLPLRKSNTLSDKIMIDDVIPCILEPQGDEKAFRKSWARLIQKIYEVDPLVCPRCQGTMQIISFIEDQSVIRDILNHLGLWLARARPPPKIHDPPVCINSAGDYGPWLQRVPPEALSS